MCSLLPRLLFLLSVLVIHLFPFSSVFSQQTKFNEDWRWVEFTQKSGLPSDHVYSITETSDGITWILTAEGLARYDEYQWHSVEGPPGAVDGRSPVFAPDQNGRVLVVFNHEAYVGNERGFRRLSIDAVQNAVPLAGESFLVLKGLGVEKSLWICAGRDSFQVPLPSGVAGTDSLRLDRASNGSIWLSARQGLFRWNEGKWVNRLRSDDRRLPLSYSILGENTQSTGVVAVDLPFSRRGVWEWTKGGEPVLNTTQPSELVRAGDIAEDGTAFFAYESGHFRIRESGRWLRLDPLRPLPRQCEKVSFRKNGDLWLCSDRGLYLLRYASSRWTYIKEDNPTPHNTINEIVNARDGSLWLATAGGLKICKPDGTVKTIDRIMGQQLYVVTGLMEDMSGRIWVSSGSAFDGVFCLDGDRWKRFDMGTPLANTRIHKIRIDKSGRLWFLGLTGGRAGVDSLGPGAFVYANGAFTRWGVEQGLPHGRVYSFDEGPDGALWFGTLAGLSRWTKDGWKHWLTYGERGGPMGRVFTLDVDDENRTWFADRSNGLGMIDSDGRIHHFGAADGLINEKIWDIRCDPRGRIWMTTPAGLSVYDHGNFAQIDARMGLSITPWPILPLYGKVYVGGLGGLAVLDLREYGDSQPRISVDQPMTSNNVVLLRWKAFSRWGDLPADQIPTRYRIDGNSWSAWGIQREATVSNMPPGSHGYEIQSRALFGGNGDDVVRGTFEVPRPLQEDPGFMVPVILLAGSVIGLAAILYIRRKKQRRLREELSREQQHVRKMAELNRVKSHFFANISHEFRTPLTLILGPIGTLMASAHDEKSQRILKTMERNARLLLSLINQLLDLSKLESGMMKMTAARSNIVKHVREIAMSYESAARIKGVNLVFNSGADVIIAYFDSEKTEKIFSNLLSNALKFTPTGGEIAVSLCMQDGPAEHSSPVFPRSSKGHSGPAGQNEKTARAGHASSAVPDSASAGSTRRPRGWVEISIKDNGVGIPEDKLQHVFDRFYQADDTATREHGGTGIGLALAKELAELHRGTIQASSSPEAGTEFIVRLPLGTDHLREDEIVQVELSGENLPSMTEAPADDGAPSTPAIGEPSVNGHGITILIVEDNADVRHYIADNLPEDFQIIEATDGVEGIEKALEHVPDLIISDVMMPRKDGYELCRVLKQDERTSHIPIILLTAKAAIENIVDGLSVGADDYLTKPFEPLELVSQVKNLIELRRRLRERFGKGVALKPGEVAVSSIDEAFLRRVLNSIETHMAESTFGFRELSSDVGLSRTHLHRKLAALTNHSPNELIRTMRLQRAMELLNKDAATVSEVAYTVGFNDPSYFSKCFLDQFGVLPSDVRKQAARQLMVNKTTGQVD